MGRGLGLGVDAEAALCLEDIFQAAFPEPAALLHSMHAQLSSLRTRGHEQWGACFPLSAGLLQASSRSGRSPKPLGPSLT